MRGLELVLEEEGESSVEGMRDQQPRAVGEGENTRERETSVEEQGNILFDDEQRGCAPQFIGG